MMCILQRLHNAVVASRERKRAKLRTLLVCRLIDWPNDTTYIDRLVEAILEITDGKK